MADMTDGNLSAILAEQGPPMTTIAEGGQYEGRTLPKRLARIAGFLYLLVAIFSAFAYFMEKKVYVSGDAAATARNVVAHSGLVRTAVVADLLQATVWVFLAMTLYVLLKHVNKNAASAMVVFVAIGAGITLLNAVFEFEGLRAATGAVNLASLGPAGSHALVLLLLDTQHYGFLIAQIFFGLWLVPLGYLAYKSGMFPKALGVLLVVGGGCYLVGTLAAFLIPSSGQNINTFVTIPSAIAEICMVVYLLVIGVKTPTPDERIPAPGLLSSADNSRSQ
jgi:dolichyl-phosphate-mannose--protein O-mannosyl transferase